MAGRTTTDRLLDALYRSLAEPQQLPEFLQHVCEATRSHVGSIHTHDLIVQHGTLPTAVGVPPDGVIRYQQRYESQNILMQRATPILETGTVVLGEDHTSFERLRNSIFWREYLSLLNADHAAGLCGLRNADNVAMISLFRTHKLGQYTEIERAWMQRLSLHWVNYCKVRQQLGTLHDTITSLEAALDRVVLAVFFVDSRSHVCRVNHGAERMLSRGDIVSMHDRRLAARNALDMRRLHHAIAAASAAVSDLNNPPKVTSRLVLHDVTGMPAAFASIHPLKVRALGDPQTRAPQATVFIRNLFSDSPEMLTEALRELFQLTPAEARLATAMYTGDDLPKAASRLGISPQTARSRLKLVFDKTGVHGQAALVKLVRELRSVLSDTVESDPSGTSA